MVRLSKVDHRKTYYLGIPENGSRIVQNGLRFLEKDFAALEAEGKASRKSFGGAPQPAAPPKKTATERYEDGPGPPGAVKRP